MLDDEEKFIEDQKKIKEEMKKKALSLLIKQEDAKAAQTPQTEAEKCPPVKEEQKVLEVIN